MVLRFEEIRECVCRRRGVGFCFRRVAFIRGTVFPACGGVSLVLSLSCISLRGPEDERGVSTPPSHPLDSTLPAMQQRRPPPAVDTGRSCWGRSQQDAGPAQGPKQTLGAATRCPRASEVAGTFLVLFWYAKENVSLQSEQSKPSRQRTINPAERKATLRKQKTKSPPQAGDAAHLV